MNTPHRVIVLGAGYAGFIAAKRLAKQLDPKIADICLINATDGFVERPRLHQLATGQRIEPIPLARLLSDSPVRLVVGWVGHLDPQARQLIVSGADGDRTLTYDTLVLANGTGVDTTAVPGIVEHAGVLSRDGAIALRRQLADSANGRVLVCGGGMTGIEAATEIAETYPRARVSLLSRQPAGHQLSPRARDHLDKAFARLRVERRIGEITAITDGRVELADGGAADFDVCVWAGGFAVPDLAARAGLQVNGQGRPIVDSRLRSVSHPDIHVIGDAAAAAGPWGDELAYGCRVGGFMGPYLADALAARLAGRPAPPFSFRYIHQCISLGRRDAVIQFVHSKDESPRRIILSGRTAVVYKDLVLRSATWLFRWPGPYLPRRRIREIAGRSVPV